MISVLEVYDLKTKARTVLKEFEEHIEAPNWMPDGKTLIYNSDGAIFTFDRDTKKSERIDTGRANQCNNDHVLSCDGKFLAVSSGCKEVSASRVWTIPMNGSVAAGEARLVTEAAPSYLHGISPDGKTLAYCAERGGEFDIYTIGVGGGAEKRLTDAPGLDDGPEYSPDGQHIWFNSVRSGLMQAWRMNADGSGQTQMTFDEDRNNWFPHVSPDSRHIVYISYRKGDVEPGAHPPNKNVEIRLMHYDGSHAQILFPLFGGQGTLNVNSWSPDSTQFAFVSYRR